MGGFGWVNDASGTTLQHAHRGRTCANCSSVLTICKILHKDPEMLHILENMYLKAAKAAAPDNMRFNKRM